MTSNSTIAEIFDEFWKWRMASTPEFATMVGNKKFDSELEHYTIQRFESDYETCKAFLHRIDDLVIEGPSITNDEKLNLSLFRAELLTFIDGHHLQGFLFPVSFLEGIHIDFQRISGWMTFETIDDYHNLLNRYMKFSVLVDETIEVLKVAVTNKLTHHLHSMEGVVEKFFELGNPQSSVESSDFYKPFSNIQLKEDISQEKIKPMISKAKEAIQQEIKPSMLKMANFLKSSYIPNCRPSISITSLPRGQEFYDACLKFHTSTDLNAKQIHQIGLEEVQRIEDEIKNIISNELKKENTDLRDFFGELRDDERFFFKSPEELMDHFKFLLNERINPKIDTLFLNAPTLPLEIVEIPPEMGGGPAAYYIAGTADGSRPGKFFVNTKRYNSQPRYECISLALHEGNPGHHLQSSFSMVTQPPLPKFRQFMEDRSYFLAPSRFPINTAFVEGWALYCESLGNDLNLYSNPYDRIGHYSEEIFRACRLVVDTGMHALGWSREQAVEFMKEHSAASEDNINSEINRYITWPGQAVGYKIGEIKLRELRSEAEQKLKNLFDIKMFHEVVLKSAGPIDVVSKEVKLYIEKRLVE